MQPRAVHVGIEDADCDIRVCIEPRHGIVRLLERAPVIEQQAHPHAAVGGGDETIDDE